jgi:hypothetical protein
MTVQTLYMLKRPVVTPGLHCNNQHALPGHAGALVLRIQPAGMVL